MSVRDLALDVLTEDGSFPLIRNVEFDVYPGTVLGIVGESGSGKTVTCMSLTRLLPSPPIYYRQGTVRFRDRNLRDLSPSGLREIQGTGIGIIFQEALSALNPVIKVGPQVTEVLKIHLGMDKKQAYSEAINLFKQVGIPSPEVRFHHYPHQLSGGLQQRVMIAIALAGNPRLLIADEPTTALDVTVQVQIIELLKKLQKEREMAIIFVSHDLGLIAEICDDVMVMYAGEMVEKAAVKSIFSRPVHPYTRLLLKTIPRLNAPRGDLTEISGQVPSPANYPAGCKFHPRCPLADGKCREFTPDTFRPEKRHLHRCWHPRLEEKIL